MAIRLSSGARLAMMNATGLKDALEDCVIEIRSGSQPATADAATTGTLLGRVTLSGGAFSHGAPTNGLEFDVPTIVGTNVRLAKAVAETWQFIGAAAGTMGYGRLKANADSTDDGSTAAVRVDFSIGTTGADLIVNSTATTIGGVSTLDVFYFDLPYQVGGV